MDKNEPGSRRLNYHVVMSLDGYIADPKGGFDWIVPDPSVDFAALYRRFDTVVMGRGTFEVVLQQGKGGAMPGLKVFVFSRTLRASDYPAVTIVNDRAEECVAKIKAKPGKDIWLFGGGVLFRILLDAGLVDVVEVAVMPVLLGGGIPLLSLGRRAPPLRLTSCERLPSGIVLLAYKLRQEVSGE
jgi:dihydrofolate reductase